MASERSCMSDRRAVSQYNIVIIQKLEVLAQKFRRNALLYITALCWRSFAVSGRMGRKMEVQEL